MEGGGACTSSIGQSQTSTGEQMLITAEISILIDTSHSFFYVLAMKYTNPLKIIVTN